MRRCHLQTQLLIKAIDVPFFHLSLLGKNAPKICFRYFQLLSSLLKADDVARAYELRAQAAKTDLENFKKNIEDKIREEIEKEKAAKIEAAEERKRELRDKLKKMEEEMEREAQKEQNKEAERQQQIRKLQVCLDR